MLDQAEKTSSAAAFQIKRQDWSWDIQELGLTSLTSRQTTQRSMDQNQQNLYQTKC